MTIRKLRGVGGPLRKKNVYFILIFFKIPKLPMVAKSKSYNRFVAIFGKKYGSLSPKIVGREKVVKICFRLF